AEDGILGPQVSIGELFDLRPIHAGAVLDVFPRGGPHKAGKILEAFGGAADKIALYRIALENHLCGARQQGDVAADVRLNIQAGDLRTEQETHDIGGHAEIDQAEFLDGVDDDDLAAATANVHECSHQARMVR